MGVIFFAVIMLYPVGKKAEKDSDEALAKVHVPTPPRSPAPEELTQAYDLAVPGYARIRCPAPSSADDVVGLHPKPTGTFGESRLRWIDIRDGHVNGATPDSSGEVMAYAGTTPVGIIRWSKPRLGDWTHCSMAPVEFLEREAIVLDVKGKPAPHVNVSLCANRATQSDAKGRFTVKVPVNGTCDLRTFDIQETELYLGQKRTIPGVPSKTSVPFKIALYGDLEHVTLQELKQLTAQRIRHLDERDSSRQYAPIEAALGLTETPEATRTILRQWAAVEREQSARIQLGELLRDDVELEDYRDALLFGALSDL